MTPNSAPESEQASLEAAPKSLDASVLVDETSVTSTVAVRSDAASTRKDREPSSGDRSPRVDTLRGLFLISMMVDHLPDNPLLHFSIQSFGFVSAAEGFVFVSGLVSAWVYGRIFAKQGAATLRHRAWHRAREIYLTHLLVYTLALLGGLWGGWEIASQSVNFWVAWWHGAALIYQPSLFDILPMYVVFMLLLPFLLQQMASDRAWLIWAGSIALWLAAQWGIGGPAYNPPWFQIGSFNILAWQILFVAGVYCGYGKDVGHSSPIPGSRLLLVFSIVLVTLLFMVRHETFFFGNFSIVDTKTAIGPWRSVNHPLRLINLAAYAYILWYLPRSLDEKVQGLSAFRFLRYLGKHSLQVFVWSIFVSFVALSFRDAWVPLSPAIRMLLAVTAMLSLIIPASAHQGWRSVVSQRAERLSGNTV